MKILMIAPTPFFSHRGTHIRILEEARALEARGHEITIVTYHNGDDIEQYIDTNIDVRRIRRWLFWYKKTEAGADWQKVILNFFLIRKVFYMTRTWKPDIVHGHLHEGVIIARMMQCLFFWRKFKVIADFHGSLVGEMRSHGYLSMPPLGTIFRLLERWINGMGNTAVVSSAENKKVISAVRKDQRAYHIYDGVDVSYYNDLRTQKASLREKYDIPQDAFVVVYTGALIANKGIQNLLDAAKILKDNHKKIFFVFGGFPAEWVHDFVHANDMGSYVRVISPLNYFSLPEVNILGDVAVDPKNVASHQASGKILQYMAAGIAIICANRPTNKKYLEDAGVYVEPLTAKRLAETIVDLVEKPQVCERKGKHAAYRALNFSWKKVGEKLEGVYKSV